MAQRLIDASAVIASLKEEYKKIKQAFDETSVFKAPNDVALYGALMQEVGAVIGMIEDAKTIDAVTLDGSFLKMSKGDYLIYNRHWLYEHFDQEIDIQRSVMKSMGYEPAMKDAEPLKEVKHGKWLWLDGVRCSQCNYKLETTGLPSDCPNCGADMRGESE